MSKLKIIYCGLLEKLKVLATQDNIEAPDQMQIGRVTSKPCTSLVKIVLQLYAIKQGLLKWKLKKECLFAAQSFQILSSVFM